MTTSFGQRLQKLRKAEKLTLEQLAKKIDSTKSYVWELENKPTIRPSAETVNNLASALKVTVEELLGERPADAADQVFFREYKELKPKTKQRLQEIMEALKKTDG